MRAGLVSLLIPADLQHVNIVSVCSASLTSFIFTVGAQSEVDYTEQLNFSDDDDQGGSNQKEQDSR